MHFINQQIDRRRCYLCAEPITGPTCARCGHLHDVRSHPEFAAVRRFVSSSIQKDRQVDSSRKSQPERAADNRNDSPELSSKAWALIRAVQETSFACGALGCDAEQRHELFERSIAAERALREYLAGLEADRRALKRLVGKGGSDVSG
jgi:hypothetical protein